MVRYAAKRKAAGLEEQISSALVENDYATHRRVLDTLFHWTNSSGGCGDTGVNFESLFPLVDNLPELFLSCLSPQLGPDLVVVVSEYVAAELASTLAHRLKRKRTCAHSGI